MTESRKNETPHTFRSRGITELGEINQGLLMNRTRAAVVHLNFRAGSTFPVPVFTVPNSMDKTSRCNKVDPVRLYASYRWNLLLLKGLDLRENETIWSPNRENQINHRTKSFKGQFVYKLKGLNKKKI